MSWCRPRPSPLRRGYSVGLWHVEGLKGTSRAPPTGLATRFGIKSTMNCPFLESLRPCCPWARSKLRCRRRRIGGRSPRRSWIPAAPSWCMPNRPARPLRGLVGVRNGASTSSQEGLETSYGAGFKASDGSQAPLLPAVRDLMKRLARELKEARIALTYGLGV